MKLPQAFLQSLQGVTGFNADSFIAVHELPEGLTSVRLNPAKPFLDQSQIPTEEGTRTEETIQSALDIPVPWSQFGHYLSYRPSFTFDPLFHAGCYYVQEASSMFLEVALKQLLDLSQPLKVLDLCAAPGGKSTHLQSLLSANSVLVSNEVIKTRCTVLTDNIIKWGCKNVLVTNNDPRAFSKLTGFFDVLVVDAPCSGSGLFRKDPDAIEEWSLGNVTLCSQRQQRILADALPCLKEGGLLLYATCSYSAEEDEAIMDWLAADGNMTNKTLSITSFTGVVETESPLTQSIGYRFYPDKIKGEGFFLSCFVKKGSESAAKLKSSKPDFISEKEKAVLASSFPANDVPLVRFRDKISALPIHLLEVFQQLQPVLNIQYAGTAIGEVMHHKFVPQHALAQSTWPLGAEAVELSYDEAVRYLQRADLVNVPPKKGWQVVRYRGHNLGWINALQNRINNYYPKEIRILKAENNTPFKKY